VESDINSNKDISLQAVICVPVGLDEPDLAGAVCDDVDAEELEVARGGLVLHVRQRRVHHCAPHALDLRVHLKYRGYE
jgi:hypothetical protein